MAAQCLLTLPKGCWSRVFSSLDAQEVKNLRLTARNVSKTVVESDHWRHLLSHQRIELAIHPRQQQGRSRRGLDLLADLAAHPFGQAVSHLTLVAVLPILEPLKEKIESGVRMNIEHHGAITSSEQVELSDDELEQAKVKLEWMQAIKHSLDKERDLTLTQHLAESLRMLDGLEALELDARLICGQDCQGEPASRDNRFALRARAARAFGIMMSAMLESAISVKALSVLRNAPCCGIHMSTIVEFFQSLEARGMTTAGLKSVERFELSILVCDNSVSEEKDMSPAAMGQDHIQATTELVRAMPGLEVLDLHFYATFALENSAVLQQVSDDFLTRTDPPALRTCKLSGITSSASSLCHFLTKHNTITHLELRQMSLSGDDGKHDWAAFIPALVEDMSPALQHLRLSNLVGRNGTTNVEPENWDFCSGLTEEEAEARWLNWSLSAINQPHILHTVELGPEDLQSCRPLKFRPRQHGRLLGSAQLRRWIQMREREHYGLA